MTDDSHSTQSAAQPALDLLVPILSCPATGTSLRRQDGALESESGRRYPLVEGVPILLADEQGVFRVENHLQRAGSGRSLLASALRWQPPLSRNVAAADNFAFLAELLRTRSDELERAQLVLVVGGATEGVGFSKLLGHPFIELVETDIAVGPRTQVVCDVQNLPFKDSSFDAVVCQAVLEYVLDPYAAVAEIHRVLVPGGLVYSEIPFLQQAHGPYDFTRFTHVGHLRLHRHFDEVRSGAVGGPGMALAWAWRAFLIAWGGRSRAAQLVGSRIAAVTAFWLPWLDGVLARRPGGLDAAAGTFFLGTRRESPVPDEEIVRAYRGAQRTLWDD